MSIPQRFMTMLATNIRSSVPKSKMPTSRAIMTNIQEALKERSIQRVWFILLFRLRTYHGYSHGDATAQWARADMNRKAATANPMGSSNSVSVLVDMVRATSSKYRKLVLIGNATELLIRTIRAA